MPQALLPQVPDGTTPLNDRVELFFAKQAALNDYWCIEIDPSGRVHDYHAKHCRKFDSDWNCPGLLTEADRTATGYEVRGSIPLATLSKLTGFSVRSLARSDGLKYWQVLIQNIF